MDLESNSTSAAPPSGSDAYSTNQSRPADPDTGNANPSKSGKGRGRDRDRGRGDSRHGGRGFGKGGKKEGGRQEQGRSAHFSRDSGNRRERNEETKRRRLDQGEAGLPVYATEFSKEEIDNEERKPKRKVAVLIGYSGTGYKGLQLSDKEKTIEGEIFQAFVAAGAVSKANADDPKKTSLVRCARTDKGVHAAGNMLSMKLIIEDDDIVKKINDNLSSQIRIWDITRVTGSFSCYQLCDSRIYEYLIPSHMFLPPHPKTYLGKNLVALAEEAGDLEGYNKRQEEVLGWWEEIEKNHIQPVLDAMDPELRDEAVRIVFEGGSRELKGELLKRKRDDKDPLETDETSGEGAQTAKTPNFTPLEQACRNLKQAYHSAKAAYRIPPTRLERVKNTLQRYVGTHNYHNYTVQKEHADPSAKRVIFSFVPGPQPILINDTEWLSLKVHGQSFMMHQIRKMVSMCALVVRCGAPVTTLEESFGRERYNIPKAPGLGLLLERPVFDNYNKTVRVKGSVERDALDYSKYAAEIEDFKQREIYERIFREEKEENQFHHLTTSLDSLRGSDLFYLSSLGYEATRRKVSDQNDQGQGDAEILEKLAESGDEEQGPEEG